MAHHHLDTKVIYLRPSPIPQGLGQTQTAPIGPIVGALALIGLLWFGVRLATSAGR